MSLYFFEVLKNTTRLNMEELLVRHRRCRTTHSYEGLVMLDKNLFHSW